MTRSAFLLPIAVIAAPVAAQPAADQLRAASAAQQLFDRDWVLSNWALKFFDRNRDQRLDAAEAATAAAEFRNIADTDSDGRISPYEYRAAREFILARY
ncbi:MAG TPA: hypothetical protein VM308_00540 [Sphingomicrobium sp.]|nr:hypothetical protein [Sphingomicrobium sp.]